MKRSPDRWLRLDLRAISLPNGEVCNLAEAQSALTCVLLDRGDRSGSRVEAQRAFELLPLLAHRLWLARAQSQ